MPNSNYSADVANVVNLPNSDFLISSFLVNLFLTIMDVAFNESHPSSPLPNQHYLTQLTSLMT